MKNHNPWYLLGEKVSKHLPTSTPSTEHFKIVAEKFNITLVESQRAWNVYKGLLDPPRKQPPLVKKNNTIRLIDQYLTDNNISVQQDEYTLTGDVDELVEQIKRVIKDYTEN